MLQHYVVKNKSVMKGPRDSVVVSLFCVCVLLINVSQYSQNQI
jgi:hypothetical protein